MAPVRFFNNDWHIVYHLNLSSLQEEFYELEAVVNRLTKLCNNLREQFNVSSVDTNHHTDNFFSYQFERQCNANFDLIKLSLEHVRDFNFHWFYDDKTSRPKRAPFNVIGSVLRSLFGTLSQEDAEDHLQRFNFMESKLMERQVVVDEQTTLLRSTIEILKTMNEDNIEINKKVNNQFREVNVTIAELPNDFENLWLNMEFQSQVDNLLTFVSLSISRYFNRQKQFLEAITFGSSAISATPIILPPSLLLEELDYVQSQISGKELTLPLPISKEYVANYYQLATTRSRIVHDQLIVAMSIPLISLRKYSIIKATSLPTLLPSGLFQFVIPTYEYIALDDFQESFVAITEAELENCQDLREHDSDSTVICSQTSPIFTIASRKEDCGVTFVASTNQSTNCDVRVSNITSQLWLSLKESNSWIGVFPTEQILYIRCTEKPAFSRVIQGIGVVKLDQDCQIKTDQLLLKATKSYFKNVYERITPLKNFNWTSQFLDFPISNAKGIIKQVDSPNVVTYGETEKLKRLSTSLEELNARVHSIPQKAFIGYKESIYSPSFWMGSIFLLLVSVVLILIGVVYCLDDRGSYEPEQNEYLRPTVIVEPNGTCMEPNETRV